MNIQKYIHLALREAKKSNLQFQHGAVACDARGRILNYGYNYSKSSRYEMSPPTQHAEAHALLNTHHSDCVNGIMFVVREGLKSSKPCKKCLGLLKRRGFRVVYYSYMGSIYREYL